MNWNKVGQIFPQATLKKVSKSQSKNLNSGLPGFPIILVSLMPRLWKEPNPYRTQPRLGVISQYTSDQHSLLTFPFLSSSEKEILLIDQTYSLILRLTE